MNKHTGINAEYYMIGFFFKGHLRPVLVQEVEAMLYYGKV